MRRRSKTAMISSLLEPFRVNKMRPSPSTPVRIALICDTYPPVIGGSEVEAQRVSAAMMQRGHRVQVFCSGGPPMPAVRNWIDPAGVPVQILTRRSRGNWKIFAFAWQVAWAIWRERNNYDVVYFLMHGLHLAAGLPVAHLVGKPIVMKISGSGLIPMMQRSRVGRLELDWLRRWAASVMVLNDGMVEEALEHGFTRDHLFWMPNPVDVNEFRPREPGEAEDWRQRHAISASARIAIYTGRLSHEKGLPELLRGFAIAVRTMPDALLILIGDGPQRAELQDLAGSLNLGRENVRFAGRVNIAEVPFWLRAADVFALTSPNEGFSCSLLEAMATGLASVVIDIPANRQLIENQVHGIMVPLGSDAAIGEAFSQLFREPDARHRMGQAARRRVMDNFSTEQVVDRYEGLLARVLKRTTGDSVKQVE